MFYEVTQIETLDRQLGGNFQFPPGNHTIESRDREWWLMIVVDKEHRIREAFGKKRV